MLRSLKIGTHWKCAWLMFLIFVCIMAYRMFTSPLSHIYWRSFSKTSLTSICQLPFGPPCFWFDQLDKTWKVDLEQMFCTDFFLPYLGTSANLLELCFDNSTPVVHKTVENLYDLITNDHSFTIFHHLNTCIQLQFFSCAHCRIHWIKIMTLTSNWNIGHFCTQWLLWGAPMSMREYTGTFFPDIE